MKHLKTMMLILGMTVISTLLSCSDDNEPGASNSIVFDGETYAMTDGLVEDYGPSNPSKNSNSETHYNFDYTIVNGTFTQFTDEFDDIEFRADDATFGVYVELLSPGTSGFQTGTFNFISGDEAEVLANIENKSFFSGAEAYLPTGAVDSAGDPIFDEFEATGGLVIVSGTGPTNYTITYNLQFTGGKTLTGSYSGTLKFSDETDAN